MLIGFEAYEAYDHLGDLIGRWIKTTWTLNVYVLTQRDRLERERVCLLVKDRLRSDVVSSTPLLCKYCWESTMEVPVGASKLQNQECAGVYAMGDIQISGVLKGISSYASRINLLKHSCLPELRSCAATLMWTVHIIRYDTS